MIGNSSDALLDKVRPRLGAEEQPVAANQVSEYGIHRLGRPVLFGVPELLGVIGTAIRLKVLNQPKPIVDFELAHAGFLRGYAYIVLTDRRVVLLEKSASGAGEQIASWPIDSVEFQVGSSLSIVKTIRLVFEDGSSITYERNGPNASRVEDWVDNGAVHS